MFFTCRSESVSIGIGIFSSHNFDDHDDDDDEDEGDDSEDDVESDVRLMLSRHVNVAGRRRAHCDVTRRIGAVHDELPGA